MKKPETRTIYQAGHVNHAGFNSWDICGYGLTIEDARKNLKELKQKENMQEDFYGRYVESSYQQKLINGQWW